MSHGVSQWLQRDEQGRGYRLEAAAAAAAAAAVAEAGWRDRPLLQPAGQQQQPTRHRSALTQLVRAETNSPAGERVGREETHTIHANRWW